MITQGPFSLSLGTTLPLEDPGATSNNPATAVQLQNGTSFIIEVNVGGSIFTIQSFTAQTVPTAGGGQMMSVSPLEGTAGGTLTVVWLLAGESAPMLDGSLTAAAITAANLPPGQIFNNSVTPASSIFSALDIPIPSNARTLVIYLTSTGGAWFTLLRVFGGPIGYEYYNQPPYLANQPSNPGVALAVVPIEGAGGTGNETISIVGEVSSGNAPVEMVVFADSDAYGEDIFYNGQVQANDDTISSGTSVLVAGPCRLLTAAVANLASSTSTININGKPVLTTQAGPSATDLSFPPNTIVAAGQSVELAWGSGTVFGAVTYAYP